MVNMESPLRVDLRNQRVKQTTREKCTVVDQHTQTDLTFPPELPPDLKAILSRYCLFGNTDSDSTDSNESNLINFSGSRKKLFIRNFNCVTPNQKVRMKKSI